MMDPLSNAGVPIPIPRGDDELASSSTLSSHGSTDNSRVYHFVTSFLNPHANANANPAAAASGPRVNQQQQQQLPRQASRSPSPLPWPLPRPPPRPRSVESETTPLMGSAATRTNARHSGTSNERPGAGAAKERSSHSSTERRTENPRFVFWVGIALLVLFASVLATYQHNNQEQDVSSTWTNDKNEDLLLYRHAGIDNGRTGSSTPSKYKKVRYFGFQIYTGAAPAFLNHRNNDSNNDSNDRNNSNINNSNINNSNNDSNDGARTVKAKAQRVPNPECIRSGEIHTGDHRARNANHTYGQVPLEDGSTGLQCYVGHEDPKTDVRERLRILRDAVEQAYEEYQSLLGAGAGDGAGDGADDKDKNKDKADDGARNEPDVLKIFAAPEFFFRGLSGAYDFSEDPRRLDRIFGFNHTTPSSSSSSSAAGNPDSDGDGTNKDDDDQFCSEDSPVCAVLVGLQEMVEDERFEDWLFLFGTVVATQTIPVEKDPTKDGTASEETTHSHDGNYEYLYYNFAPVYKGFDPKKLYHPPRKSEQQQQQQQQHQQHFALGKRFLVPKRYVSTIDFLTPTRDIEWRDRGSEWEELFGPDNDNDDDNDESSSSALDADSRSKIHHPSTKAVDNPRTYLHKRYDDDWFAAYKNRLYDRAGYVQVEYDWLVVDDIAFTIEVCLDHELRTALDAYNGDVVTGKTTRIPATSSSDGILRYVPIPNQQAQIGLVASAGMSPNTESLALAQNGILLLQDGLSNQTARRFVDYELREQCGSQQEVQFEGGTVAVRRRAKVSKTEVRFEYDLLSSSSSNGNGNSNGNSNGNMDDDPDHCGTTSGGMMTADDEEVVACEHKVPVYDGKTATPDDVDDPTKGASVEYWKTKLRGIFSTEMYEPHLVLYGPFDIPQADI